MKRITEKELKEIQLGILDCVAEFCESKEINYWLDSGTLLGAVRHNGYIPWDDDIDIGMLRSDYSRFCESFNNYNDNYKLSNITINPNARYAFGKVYDINTILYEPDTNGIKSYINIDLFIYDDVPNDAKVIEQMYKRRDVYQKLNVLKYHAFYDFSNIINVVKNLTLCVGKTLLFPFPNNHFVRLLDRNAQTFANIDSDTIGNFYGFSKFTAPKSYFYDFIDICFEGKKYKVPKQYDKWLTLKYGNYMTLPPIENQVSHHSFIAYRKGDY